MSNAQNAYLNNLTNYQAGQWSGQAKRVVRAAATCSTGRIKLCASIGKLGLVHSLSVCAASMRVDYGNASYLQNNRLFC